MHGLEKEISTGEAENDRIARAMEEADRFRFQRPGVNWKLLAVLMAAVAAATLFGHFVRELSILMLLYTVLMVIHNGIFMLAARLCGVREILAFGIGIGPAVTWFRVKGLLIQLNLIPAGAYVRFPYVESARSIGFRSVSPARQAIVMLSAPVVVAIVGWGICVGAGIGDAPGRVVAALAHLGPNSWKDCRQFIEGFLRGMWSWEAMVRATGVLMLGTGVTNLLPAPILSGGMAMLALTKALFGEKAGKGLMMLMILVGMPLYLLLFGAAAVMLIQVLLGKPVGG